MDVIHIEAKQCQIFRVGDRDYALSFPVSVVAELEAKLGRPMKRAGDWLNTQTKEVQTILEAGFKRYHEADAKQVAEDICTALDPEEIENVIDGLCAVTCPKAMARIKEEMKKALDRVKNGLPALPNVPGAVL